MQSNVSTHPTANKSPANEQAGVISLAPLRDSLKELERAAPIVKDHQAACGDLLHIMAEKTGLAAPVIRSFIAARLVESDQASSRRIDRAQQLAMVFEEVSP